MEKHLPCKAGQIVLTLGHGHKCGQRGSPLLCEEINSLIMVLNTAGCCTVHIARKQLPFIGLTRLLWDFLLLFLCHCIFSLACKWQEVALVSFYSFSTISFPHHPLPGLNRQRDLWSWLKLLWNWNFSEKPRLSLEPHSPPPAPPPPRPHTTPCWYRGSRLAFFSDRRVVCLHPA